MDSLRTWYGRFSLTARITVLIVAIMTIGLGIAGVGTMTVLRQSLMDSTDRDLDSAVAAYDDIEIGVLEPTPECGLELELPQSFYLALMNHEGTLLCDNSEADGSGLPRVDNLNLAVVGASTSAFTVNSVEGQNQYRVRAVPVPVSAEGHSQEWGILVIATGLDGVETTWRAFVIVYTGFALLAIILGAAFTRILAVSTLKPLRRVAETAELFADGNYDSRLDAVDPRTEVGSLTMSLNTMLARIDTALEQRDASVIQMRQFVGDASHELRTPLVSVRGYAELYRMGALQKPEDVANAMDRIEKEAKRMATLVEDLLTLARLDERRPLQLEPLDLAPLVADAASDARASASDRSFTVVAIDPDLAEPVGTVEEEPPPVGAAPPIVPPAVVLADENSIRQVIANLIGNALRYTPEGTPIELGVGVSWRRREAVVTVIDHGEGVPVNLREKIFQRFYRTDKSRARETGGSGLGLAIVDGIVKAHSGRIDVVETVGGGATFRIAVPLASDEALHKLADLIRPEHTTTSRSRPHPSVSDTTPNPRAF